MRDVAEGLPHAGKAELPADDGFSLCRLGFATDQPGP
jgi:hypothetical protein